MGVDVITATGQGGQLVGVDVITATGQGGHRQLSALHHQLLQ